MNLYQAILKHSNHRDLKKFFENLCTPQEIKLIEERWNIVLLLRKNLSYREIASMLKVSTTTVTRVARCLNEPNSAYLRPFTKRKEDEK